MAIAGPPAPFTPPDCDLQSFPFMPLDVTRLLGSDFNAQPNDAAWRAGVILWARSWHQVPAASLPNDDAALARLADLGRDVRAWRKVREGALHGWTLCSDGRFYHRVVAEKALEAWLQRLEAQLAAGRGNAARWKTYFDVRPLETAIAATTAMLAEIAPQSKSLKAKKSPPDRGGIAPRSQPDRQPIAPRIGSRSQQTVVSKKKTYPEEGLEGSDLTRARALAHAGTHAREGRS